ncbi:MAG: DUF58 domain-containing protein [Chloroflexi bacterium]|nr:DUF58 domain-containing protein [Chloroflexota bacterium]MBV9546820.1 DUF58 domain-containing protein [Chloroflexota bacterium]
MMMEQPLFDARFLRVLEQLRIAGRRVMSGETVGQWRSRAAGSSVEFADYRTYAAGDDFRRIDWNAYARLERLFVRIYRAEENLALTVLVDASASMAWGSPSKARLAAQLAGALSFVALREDERVDLVACKEGATTQRAHNLNGQAGVWPMWRFLERLTFGGVTDLDASLGSHARQLRRSGLAVVISDLLSPNGYQEGIDALLGRRQDVVLLHVLAPDELDPPAEIVGEWRLHDVESEWPLDATITPSVVRAYRRLVGRYCEEAADFCRRRGVTYLMLRSDVDVEDVLLRTLRRAGVLV